MNAAQNILQERLKAHSHTFHPVVDFNPKKEKIISLDFTNNNKDLLEIDFADTEIFSSYVEKKLKKEKAKYGIGGYDENRTFYKRSKLFEAPSKSPPTGETLPTHKTHYKYSDVTNNYPQQSSQHSSPFPPPLGEVEGARSLHLGVDIWGEQGTKVYAPLGGMVHSFAFNNNFGDYGATLILLHQLDTVTFYTLYGHLSLDDIAKVTEFQYIVRGHEIGHFGKPEENGHWPPHLHFQIIKDIRTYKGDYRGVCKYSERKKYLANCPDPDLILGMMQYVTN